MNKNIEQLIYWKLKTTEKEQGFITLEVIIALIVGLVFFAFSLQAFAFAIVMKGQAQEKQRANELIQEDIERISQLGSNPDLAAVLPLVARPNACNPVATTAPARTEYENGYANALWTALIAAAPNNINNSNNPATLGKTLFNKIRTTAGTGAGEGVGSIETYGRTLALRRFYVSNGAGASDAPHRTLKIGYQVWYWDSTPGNPGNNTYLTRADTVPTVTDDAIAETYVEIIPDVALSCP